MMPEQIDSELSGEPLPDYVTDAYETFYRARAPGAMKFKDALEGKLYKKGGRYYLYVGRYVMANQEDWGYIPEDDVDERAIAEEAFQAIDDLLPFEVSFTDAGDMYDIFVGVPIRPDDDHEALIQTVLTALLVDSLSHFQHKVESDRGVFDPRYLSSKAIEYLNDS